jgi:hypothetical protein
MNQSTSMEKIKSGRRPGVYSAAYEATACRAWLPSVVMRYVGQALPARAAQERTASFRCGLRVRAGIAGCSSVLRRRFGPDRCRDHGEAGLGCCVGWGCVTADLLTIAHTVAVRYASRAAKAACSIRPVVVQKGEAPPLWRLGALLRATI